MTTKAHALEQTVRSIFGAPSDRIESVSDRAARLLPGKNAIVWEGDPTTFQFSFVSPSAEAILGHAVARWTNEKTFWADTVVHPDDRDDAIAYCALATAKAKDHAFEYRAVTKDGRVVWLLDFVSVLVGPKGIPARLRGLMVEVAKEENEPAWQSPSREDLSNAAE